MGQFDRRDWRVCDAFGELPNRESGWGDLHLGGFAHSDVFLSLSPPPSPPSTKMAIARSPDQLWPPNFVHTFPWMGPMCVQNLGLNRSAKVAGWGVGGREGRGCLIGQP